MKRYTFTLAAFFILSIVASSCFLSRSHGEDPSTPDSKKLAFLEKHDWKLIQINGKVATPSPAYLSFDRTAKRFSGNGSCNRIFGELTLTADTLSFCSVASTRMACLNDTIARQEQAFIQLLDKADLRYDIADQTLNLYQDNRLVLMFGMTEKVK